MTFSELLDYNDSLMDNIKNYWSDRQYDEIQELLKKHHHDALYSLKKTFEPFENWESRRCEESE